MILNLNQKIHSSNSALCYSDLPLAPMPSSLLGEKTVYAIAFDVDTDILSKIYGTTSWRNAYKDIENTFKDFGLTRRQGSVYFGDEQTTPVDCVLAVQSLDRNFAWFKPCAKDFRLLRIESNHDLLKAI